jgi:acetyl-CoA carboxylase biotin carboxylase subunit
MIKATAGGGGKGMRAVWKAEDLKDHWESAIQEAVAAFGNGGMYMEKLIEEPRHIEIQVAGDQLVKLATFLKETVLYKEEIRN